MSQTNRDRDDADARHVSRRDFLRTSAAGAATAALSMGSLSALASARPYGPFRMGIQSFSLRGFNFDTALNMTSAWRLPYWEAFSGHVAVTDDRARIDALLAQFRAAGVRLVAYGVEGFDGNEEHATRVFEFARAMGVECITANPAPAAFPILDRLTRRYRINIAIHNHGPGARYDSLESVLAPLRDTNHRVGACIDTGHFIRSGVDPVEAVRALGRRVHGVHLKDARRQNTDTDVGQGELRLVDFLVELRRLRFRGPMVLEYELEPQNPSAGIDRSLAATRDAIARAMNRRL
ncbi:MAG TPA: sugar phosphate isomerase/epimerase [Chthonomonadales bacterium]|nr:sugar phosphate isomerase/epimerase [Chthonomonadales bacterium]